MIKNLLNPKWQHPDAEIRRQAVEEGRLKDDILLELASTDPDTGVRSLAVSRVQDLQQLIALAATSDDAREIGLPARVHDLLLASDAAVEHDSKTLQRCGELCTDQDLRRSLLLNAPQAALRRMMAEVVQQEDALEQCALNDRSGDVRRAAVMRIDDEERLRLIAKQLRGSDKTTARLAEEKRSQLQQQRETETQRQSLLAEMQAFADGSQPLEQAAVDRLVRAWESVADTANTASLEKFTALQADLQPKLARQQQLVEQEREARSRREDVLRALSELEEQCPELIPEEAAQRLAGEQARWQALDPMQNPGAQQRFDHDFDDAAGRIREIIASKRGQNEIQQRIDTVIHNLEARLRADRVSTKDVSTARKKQEDLADSIKDRAAFDKPLQRVRNLADKLESRLEEQQAREKSLHEELKKQVDALEAHLQDKALRPALAAHKKAHETLVAAGNPVPSSFRKLEKRLHQSEPALRELKSWRNWSTDHVREDLINEALALCETPPANVEKLAAKLTDLRSRWKALGPLEPGAKAQWEKFDEACTRAHEPVKARHDADAKARREHLEQRKAICKQLEDLVSDTDWEDVPDWHALDRAMGEARRQWNRTGGVPHKAWPAIKKRFDAAIRDLDKHLEPERERNFSMRQRLVHQAEQLAQEEDNRAATAAARELRAQWQVSVHSPNRKEKKLWEAFNKAMDSVFQKDRAAREQFKASLDENQHQAEVLCKQLEQLAGEDDQAVRTRRDELQQVKDQFSKLNLPRKNRRDLEKRFDRACRSLEKRIRGADETLRQAQLEQLYGLHALCTQMEAAALGQQDAASVDDLRSQWEATEKPATHKSDLHRIEKRWQAALAVIAGEQEAGALGDLEANAERKRTICTDLEILLHLETPDQDSARRMQRQVELMENAMKGMGQNSPDRIRELRLSYLGTGPVQPALLPELEARFTRLLNPSD